MSFFRHRGHNSRTSVNYGRGNTVVTAGLGTIGVSASTANRGYVMTRPGSIVGVAWNSDVSVETVAGDLTLEVQVNGVATLVGGTFTTAGVAQYSTFAVAEPGLHRFAAGDVVALFLNFDTFVGTVSRQTGVVEVQYDD